MVKTIQDMPPLRPKHRFEHEASDVFHITIATVPVTLTVVDEYDLSPLPPRAPEER